MRALEQQYAVLRTAHWMLDVSEAADPSDLSLSGLRFAAEGATTLLPHAETYCWSGPTSAAVQAAALSVPDSSTLRLEDLPSGVSWWWFDEPVPIALPDPDTSTRVGREIGAIVIGPVVLGPPDAPERLALIVHRWSRRADDEPSILMPTSVYAIPPDRTLGNVRDDVALSFGGVEDDTFRLRRGYEVMRFVIAAAAWLRQRILVTSDGHVERHRRKQLAREFDTPVASTVKIIELRRLESDAPRDPNAEPVEWSCRWIVTGHWRQQPYKDGIRPIYIHPFVKGPADKPLRVPTHTVFHAHR